MKKEFSKQETGQLVSLVFVMGRHIKEDFQKLARQASCSFIGFQALRYIKETEKPSMRDVASHFMVTPPAATLLIDGLVEEKLIARVADKRDRRAVRLYVTLKGNALLERGTRVMTRALAKLFGNLTPAERAQFIALLKKVVKEK
ncbi:MAG TPA: MarR family transcriptional regulator [Candidatus Paceibacterota bacterium]|jgi:DNA-binding MarR family transcriptional regulator|nr:MarR family transcriptional regulator [Candidatus Paceibacterota bacterium]